MNGDQTGERIRSAFAQLARQQPELSQLDHAIMTAFEGSRTAIQNLPTAP